MTICWEKYQEALAELPKGTIFEKQVKGNTYYYLKHREGKKDCIQIYWEKEIEELKQQIDKRRYIEAMIKSLLEELKIAEKGIGGSCMILYHGSNVVVSGAEVYQAK